MKTLLLIRHASSDPSFYPQSDKERRLNQRGRTEAETMAAGILARKIIPDLLISSTATRALETARTFGRIFGKKDQEIVQEEQLYEPGVMDFFATIEKIADEIITVFLFSHNPAITYFVNEMESMKISGMPPCGMVALKIMADSWSNFSGAKKEILFYDYPKEL